MIENLILHNSLLPLVDLGSTEDFLNGFQTLFATSMMIKEYLMQGGDPYPASEYHEQMLKPVITHASA